MGSWESNRDLPNKKSSPGNKWYMKTITQLQTIVNQSTTIYYPLPLPFLKLHSYKVVPPEL